MLTKRTLVLLGLCTLVCVAALVRYRAGLRADADTKQTATIVSTAGRPLSPGTVGKRTDPPQNAARAARSALSQQPASAATASVDPVYLESIGVIERLQKSRHDFYSPVVPGAPQLATFRFTLDRQPLVKLANQQAIVAWPVNDGGVEFVKLSTIREQDGNLFIGGDVVDGRGQFAMVMTADNSMSGQLLSPRGMYSYNSQLDEIVGQRVEGPIKFD